MRSFFLRTSALLSACALPLFAQAHEVYVLPREVFDQALALPAFSVSQTILQNLNQFVLWGCIAIAVILVVFFVSTSRTLERLLDPLLAKLPRYAPFIGRVTIGLAFITAAQHQALFGPELPLAATFGNASGFVAALLVIIGAMFIAGVYVRTAALAALALFAIEISVHGVYMLTYTSYLGKLVLFLILGAHAVAFHSKSDDDQRVPAWLLQLKKQCTPYAFLTLRVAFGISLLYAALYAKVFHNTLALSVAYAYPQIVSFFGFEPHFLVLGAAILEILIALFFILGVEIRFTSLFLLFWLFLSLWYFGEVVWPHIILIGTPLTFIFYGYDRYSLEGRFFKRGSREPVL